MTGTGALDRGWLLLNLGMGGEILLTDRDHLPEKYRLIFDLDDGAALAVNFWWFGFAHFAPPDPKPDPKGFGKPLGSDSPGIDLDTHVKDLLALLFFEDLREVIIVGHSYGGVLIPPVLERAAGRMVHAVFLDAPVPRPGQSLFDLLPSVTIGMTARADDVGEGWNVPPFEGNYFGITDREDLEWVMACLTPHPLATLQQPAQFSRAPSSIVPCTFLACQWAMQTYGAKPPQAEGMRYVELPTAHAAMITAPRELADILLDLR